MKITQGKNTFQHCAAINSEGKFAQWWRELVADGYGADLDEFALNRLRHSAALAYNQFGRNGR